ncbi:hypothetical protein [Vallicoccus soli]|uniref:Uncharacterized protein n=1 Tax=Vallicoccus soli TaxID=2339232 RepID=A0A3A3YS84_9ACTN|nr:hypothetical protein [Vallicoccus soli]RJK92531.1 hypothetical protein D5H78_18820 [Vallicoccus soli]
MTVPASFPQGRRSTPTSGDGVAPLCRALDALLFAPAGWFAIDAGNRKVPGVTPGTLEQALALVGRGAVATVVGQLRPGVVGVDVDAAGALGDTAAEALRDWCAARGLWHLLRPSGGGPGRWHLFVVPGVHDGALRAHVDALRRELRLGSRLLDVRTQLRPLSAPHRRTGAPGASCAPASLLLDEVLADLRRVLEPLPERVRVRREEASSSGPSRPTGPGGLGQPAGLSAGAAAGVPRQRGTGGAAGAGGPGSALTPLPRPRRNLPAAWAAYLERGRAAAARLDPGLDRDPSTRSQVELEATWALVLAGYTEPEAWAAITAAHPSAFAKARARGRRWWWTVWNRCVLDADGWLRDRRATAASSSTGSAGTAGGAGVTGGTGVTVADRPARPGAAGAAGGLLEATQRVRAALEAVWRSWPVRTRHTDVEVLTTVLERMDRVGSCAVPIPQRDLVLDCAVASRTTVRAALARLQGAGLLQVVPTYQLGTTDTAHTLALPEQFAHRQHLIDAHQPDRTTHEAAHGTSQTSQASLEKPQEQPRGSAVSLTGPSRCQPPLPAGCVPPAPPASPRLPLPLRRGLGLPTCSVLRHLPPPKTEQHTQAGSQVGTEAGTSGVHRLTSLAELAYVAGLLEPGQHGPTARQLRTLREHLRTLAAHGLATVDEHGNWHAVPWPAVDASDVVDAGDIRDIVGSADAPDTADCPDSAGLPVRGTEPAVLSDRAALLDRVQEPGQDRDAAVREQIAAERAAFRDRLDPQRRRARWQQQREAALARAAKAARARQKAWWSTLEPAERQRRRTALAEAFNALSPADQARRKQQLAEARAAAGEHEATRYTDWLNHLSPTDLTNRSTTRAAAYARRSAHEQQQLAAAWAEHRARWALPHHRRRSSRWQRWPAETPLAVGDSSAEHNVAMCQLTRRAVPDADELVLFDAGTLAATAGESRQAASARNP